MKVIRLHDKQVIASALRLNTQLHLYELGDLDDFFWRYTTWYTLNDQNPICDVALLYSGTDLPVLLALAQPTTGMQTLLNALLPLLPKNFYAHLSAGLEDIFAKDHLAENHGLHLKMSLTTPSKVDAINTHETVHLTQTDLDEIKKFYEVSYPGNWFDERMLETGMFFGVRREKKLVSIAGIHVYSPQQRVAALGNITTHPDFRGQGLATIVTAKLCQELSQNIEHVGLNVLANNDSAIACYKKLGFEEVGQYGEWMMKSKSKDTL